MDQDILDSFSELIQFFEASIGVEIQGQVSEFVDRQKTLDFSYIA